MKKGIITLNHYHSNDNRCGCGRNPWNTRSACGCGENTDGNCSGSCGDNRNPWNTRSACGCGESRNTASTRSCACGGRRIGSYGTVWKNRACPCKTEQTAEAACPQAAAEECFLKDRSLAMVYAPTQHFEELYDPRKGLCSGTIFCRLDKPFYGDRRGC